jgi:hypothetical protein
MVEVAGAVGRLASVGLVGRKREGRDGTAVAATSIRGNPRRTVFQDIDILLSERVALLIDLAHGRPGVVELSGGCKITTDGYEGTNEAGEDSNAEEGERRRVGDHTNEEAWKVGTSEHTCIERKGQKHEEQTQILTGNGSRDDDQEKPRYPNKPVCLAKIDWTGETDMEESHGNNDKDACGPDSASEPKSDSGKRVESNSSCWTTEGLGDDLPEENDKSEEVGSSDPEVSLVGWGQLLKVRKTEFGL